MSINITTLDILGKTMADVVVDKAIDEVIFTTTDGETYIMRHIQDCCEEVYIEDIIGDVADLIGSEILQAELVTEDCFDGAPGDDCMWSFYKFATVKGYVTFRWMGSSNGYYSIEVNFDKVKGN